MVHKWSYKTICLIWAIHGHIWSYMNTYEPYMSIYDYIWSIYGPHMVHIWTIYGAYMVHIWTIYMYGPYMVIYGPYTNIHMGHRWTIYKYIWPQTCPYVTMVIVSLWFVTERPSPTPWSTNPGVHGTIPPILMLY